MFLDEKRQGETQAPITLEPWRQLLLDGANEMEKRGHCKGALTDTKGRVCFYGALNVADHNYASFTGSLVVEEAGRRMSVALGSPSGSYMTAVVWNNNPGLPAAEVVAKMREVARS